MCTVDASIYFETEYLAPDVKIFSCMLSSFGFDNPVPHLGSKMPLTYVVYIHCGISLAKGHLGSSGEHI